MGVVGVQFKLDGANLGAEDTTAPYSVTLEHHDGAPTARTRSTAVARDAAGNGTTAAVSHRHRRQRPRRRSRSPRRPTAPPSRVPTVTVSATASDNVGVAGVQFKLDGANLGAEDTTAPYSVTWNTTTATNGSHTLTARRARCGRQ